MGPGQKGPITYKNNLPHLAGASRLSVSVAGGGWVAKEEGLAAE